MTVFFRCTAFIALALFCAGFSAADLPSPAPPAPPAPEESPLPWWRTIRFLPLQESVRGVPAASLDPAWVKVSELRKEDIPRELLLENGEDVMEGSDLAFSRQGDFNRDGVPDAALVGVYRSRTGETGSFLLILTKAEGDAWSVAHVASWPGVPGFRALSKESETIEVWACLQCGEAVEFRWDKAKGRYTSPAPEE